MSKKTYRFFFNGTAECPISIDEGSFHTEIRARSLDCQVPSTMVHTLTQDYSTATAYLTIKSGQAVLSNEQIFVPYVPVNPPATTQENFMYTTLHRSDDEETIPAGSRVLTEKDALQYALDLTQSPDPWTGKRTDVPQYGTNGKWDMPIDPIPQDVWYHLHARNAMEETLSGAVPYSEKSPTWGTPIATKASRFDFADPAFYQDPFVTYNSTTSLPNTGELSPKKSEDPFTSTKQDGPYHTGKGF